MRFSQNDLIADLEGYDFAVSRSVFGATLGATLGATFVSWGRQRRTYLPARRDLGAQIFDRATGGNVEISFGLRGVDDATRRVDEDVFSA